ncbi:hypothetical protein BU17DRAFT_68437 [Hysterangium stoloniferum]|nr:hypothetical protein BU17DRAFT_68437 [Hysterangium stoloniferum]
MSHLPPMFPLLPLSKSLHIPLLCMDNDDGILLAVNEHQDHYVGSEEDVLSTMQNIASEGELVEQLQSGQLSCPNTHVQQLKLHLDFDSTSELTTPPDEDNLEPSNNLPKPSPYPHKRVKSHSSYTTRKVQMKSDKKPGVESYVFKTFVNDGNNVYQSVEVKYELEWLEGLHNFFKEWLHKALYKHEESDWTAHMYKASLIQVFDGKRKVMNFLDIPATVLLCPPDILLHHSSVISYDILAGNHAMNDMVGFPQYVTRWRHCASEGALLRAHIDAGKFGTWIHMGYILKYSVRPNLSKIWHIWHINEHTIFWNQETSCSFQLAQFMQ